MSRDEMIKNWNALKAHDPALADIARETIEAFDCTGIAYIQGKRKPEPEQSKTASRYVSPFL